jgi:protein involved in polysaccharide export with SLBB domain
VPALLVAALAAGCMSTAPTGRLLDADAIRVMNGNAGEATYRLAPGDRISVKLFFDNALSEDVTVRPDGRISLQLVGDVAAAGRTPGELAAALTQAYATALRTSADRYSLAVGERISIKSFYHDKLNEDVVVRPDGKVSMQLIGEVQAAGVTPESLAADIRERLKPFVDAPDVAVIVREVRRPDVTVIVRESAGQRVFVGGEVKQPGVLPLHDGLGVLAATYLAGGSLETAQLANVILLRREGAAAPVAYSVDARAILAGEVPDVALRPFDVVYVPKTNAAEAAAWLRQNIYNLLPSQFLATLGYQINPQVKLETK